MKLYRMTQEDLDKLLSQINAARNTPLIALQCGMPRSPQEAANDAWKELGSRMGFDYMTVQRGSSGDNLEFMAEPSPVAPEAVPG